MCKLNASEVISSFNEIVNQANAGKQTAESAAKALYAKAAELRAMADSLTLLARQLSGNTSGVPAGRETIYLKEGERHPKAPKPGRKPSKAKKSKKPISEYRRMQLQEQCRMMRERKQKQALVEHFAETKIS